MNLSRAGLAWESLLSQPAGLEKKLSFPTRAKSPVASAGSLPYETAIVQASKDVPSPGIGGLSLSKCQKHQGCLYGALKTGV